MHTGAFVNRKYGKILKNTVLAMCSAVAGFLNGIVGSGGGMVYILALSAVMPKKKTQEVFSSVSFAVLGLCIVSAVIYAVRGDFSVRGSLRFAISGVFGGAVGALLLNRTNAGILKIILALLLFYSGGRLIFS